RRQRGLAVRRSTSSSPRRECEREEWAEAPCQPVYAPAESPYPADQPSASSASPSAAAWEEREVNPSEAYRQAAEFMQALDGALEEMRKQGRLLAEAEHEYRLGRAKAYAECPPLKRGVYTSDQREADVDAMVAPLRENRDQHDVLYRSAREAVQ